MQFIIYIFAGLLSFLLGFLVFIGLVRFLKIKLQTDNEKQRQQILSEAKQQVTKIKVDAEGRNIQRLQSLREELESELQSRQEDLKLSETEILAQEESVQIAEALLKKKEKELESASSKVKVVKEIVDVQVTKLGEVQVGLKTKLEQISQASSDSLKNEMKNKWMQAKQLDAQKFLKNLSEELNISSKRLGARILSRSLNRYAPEFVWPKPINHVELEDQQVVNMWMTEEHPVVRILREISGANIELIAETNSESGSNHFFKPHVKLVGGYGIYREASRLSLEELKTKGPQQWMKVQDVYRKHVQSLEEKALKLGKMAMRELRLQVVHPEILKMVGSLNWRTSYRQNQYLHSLEVARLAGMLADELGVDPEHAKRCGLLHDIGKSIDYRIEGSHAVISGDYADRYGESRLICDSVMSHHNDLRVETPLAFVLKAADTLSGARPGARVNLEEGYQIRLSAIEEVVRSFPGVAKHAIMNGGREVHVEVNHKRIKEHELESLTSAIARKIEEQVQFPGQIKVQVMRRFESSSVA